MEIFRVVVYMFQMLGKLILGIVHLVGRLFFGGEKKKIEQDDDMKEIFGEDIAMEGEMEQADKIFYKAMTNAIKRTLMNLDDSFLKVIDNMSEEEFKLLIEKLESDVQEEGDKEIIFDRIRGDFTDAGKDFIEKKLFSSLVPEGFDKNKLEEAKYHELEIDKQIIEDEYFKSGDFLRFLRDEYGLSENLATKSLSVEEFEKIKLLFDNYKAGKIGEEEVPEEQSEETPALDENFRHVFKESEELTKFIWTEYGITFSVYKELKPEELEIINKRYVNFIKENKIFPQKSE